LTTAPNHPHSLDGLISLAIEKTPARGSCQTITDKTQVKNGLQYREERASDTNSYLGEAVKILAQQRSQAV